MIDEAVLPTSICLLLLAGCTQTEAPPPAANQHSEFPATADGRISVAIGADSLPVIAFSNYVPNYDNDLRFVKCNDRACAGGDDTFRMITEEGGFPSLAIGGDGLPIIAYHYNFGGPDALDLRVAKCHDASCSPGAVTISTVDSGRAGAGASIFMGSDGLPMISYVDTTGSATTWGGNLEVAKCGDAECSEGNVTISVVDDSGRVLGPTSAMLGSDALPVIAYLSGDPYDRLLRVAKCVDPACSEQATLSKVDRGHPDLWLSVGQDGLPIISYSGDEEGSRKVAKCNDPACLGEDETITTLVAGGQRWDGGSLVISPHGVPVLSGIRYLGDLGEKSELVLVRCNDAACTGGDELFLPITRDGAPSRPVMTLGADGFPILAYKKRATDRLWITKCANEFCAPYFWRR